MRLTRVSTAAITALILASCASTAPSASAGDSPATAPEARPAAGCRGGPQSARSSGMSPSVPENLHVPTGLSIETIAQIGGARELAALPNGDLLVGSGGGDVYLLPDAEAAGAAGAPQVFAAVGDSPAAGVAFARDRCTVLVGTQHGVWSTPYHDGDLKAADLTEIAKVRQGTVAPNSDGDVHVTTSVAYVAGIVYVSVGSSCNAYEDSYGVRKPCREVDPTRAAISQMNLDGSDFHQRTHKMRNAIAVTIDPANGDLWAGGAGQDDLPFGHPYEYLDDVSAHPGNADYGWPECEENHQVYWPSADCARQVVPRIELPAYSTIVGDVFYPSNTAGAYALPERYRGALLATVHGSWHTHDGKYVDPPHVVWIPMRDKEPAIAIDWSDPRRQWRELVTGFEPGGTRIGRPTGIAVGSKGSLFVADDRAGVVYRIRPKVTK